MTLGSLFFIAIGLSMDAFAISVCKGLALQKIKIRHGLIVGLWFGFFQALMPALGYLAGYRFQSKISFLDHWIAFILLGCIGINMIRESFSKDEECTDASLCPKAMLPLAVATSIDALAVGVSFSFIPSFPIIPGVLFIGIVTFFLSGAGVKIGSIFGTKYKSKAEFAGGIILIVMGTKILIEHLINQL